MNGICSGKIHKLSNKIYLNNREMLFWLVGCFGLNGSSRQYYSLYRAVSLRVGGRREMIHERKNVQTSPTLTYCKRSWPLPYCNPNLKVILNRLKPQAEEIIAEEQAGLRAGRSTTEQIFNLRILCEKYLQHQQNLYHVFIDLKKAFDRVWHAALWATMRKYNISANLVRTIEQLYDKATSAVQMNGSIGEWFRTTVRVRQGCLLSPTLFNIFLERIMSDALEEHDGKVSIGGRNITNLRFADDIDALAEEEQELEALVESLDKTCTRYKMEISAEKTKLMTNSANGIQREIKVKGQKLGTVTSFKYLGAVVSELMMAPNQRFSHGLHKPLQLLQS